MATIVGTPTDMNPMEQVWSSCDGTAGTAATSSAEEEARRASARLEGTPIPSRDSTGTFRGYLAGASEGWAATTRAHVRWAARGRDSRVDALSVVAMESCRAAAPRLSVFTLSSGSACKSALSTAGPAGQMHRHSDTESHLNDHRSALRLTSPATHPTLSLLALLLMYLMGSHPLTRKPGIRRPLLETLQSSLLGEVSRCRPMSVQLSLG